MSNPLETQVGGGHYKDLKIQPVEFIHANGLGFMEGAVIKYVARHKAKNGRQDIEKAIHFLQLLLELEYPEDRPGEEKPNVIGKASIAFGPNSYWVQCAGCDKKFYDIAPLHSCCKECAPDSYAENPHHHQIAVEPLPPAPAPIAESEESTGAGATLDQSPRWPVRMGERVEGLTETFDELLARLYKEREDQKGKSEECYVQCKVCETTWFERKYTNPCHECGASAENMLELAPEAEKRNG